MAREFDLLGREKENFYLSYSDRPVYLGSIKECVQTGKLQPTGYYNVEALLPNGERVKFGREQQIPRVKETIDGLLEDLAPGSEIANQFYEEVWPEYQDALTENPDFPRYGNMFYYPDRKDLVLYAPKYWHQVALLARNSLLLRDEEQTILWNDQREKFRKIVVGVAGASVGKNVFLRTIDTLQPDWIKIGDPRRYKDTNARRTDLSYWEVGQNKAVIAAQQAHRNDPYINISVYSEGVHENNFSDFISGKPEIGEPKVTDLVEETDDPDVKIKLRIEAKSRRKKVYMISDIGAGYQIDFRNFEEFPNSSLAPGVEDNELFDSQLAWHQDRANRELFWKFAFKLIGSGWQQVPEFRDLVLKRIESPYAGGIPQLGVAAHSAACHVALMIAQKSLGYRLPERTFVDLKSRKIVEEGSYI